ncbi:MAG: hypothetical protein IJ629_06760 [Clostridia bacterium]|nr:hypothetical protein [Clostridia bacterium]
MERKGRKANYKKLIAILCIFALLQSYFSVFAQIVIATSEQMIGGEDSIEVSQETQDEQTDENPFISQGETNVDPALGGDEDPAEEPLEEAVAEEKENPVEETEEEEEPVEEPIEESGEISENPEEEPTEEPVEEPVEEEPVEEEPYVAPEVNVEVTSENTSIYKGYLYANATSELRYATDYNTIDKISIVGGKNITLLTVQDEPDKMQLITNSKIGLMNQMYYRQTRIAVDEFETVLGEDGNITLYTPEGETLGYINKNSNVIDGEYIFIYPMQLDSVKFELTNIIGDGTISIKNDKAIKESTIFSRNQISLFSSINTIAQVSVHANEEEKNTSYEGNINLEETESRMVIDVDTNTLSVEGQNELAINVTLKTDEERYDLFENPTIDLEFPSAIEDIEVTGITLLYKNGLSIDNWNVVTNTVGRKVLKINLSGSQMEYTPGAVQEGTTVVIYSNVNVNRLTADTSETLRMTYTNKDTVRKTYMLEGKDSEDISLAFVGRQELVRAMEIKTSDENKKTSYDEDTEKIQIEPNKEQIVTINSSIVNNYEATLDEVVIIGRIPFVGNKDGNGNDLGTNFDTRLENQLATSGVIADVYYSVDGAADKNADSWVQEPEDLSQVKSYKIVVREKTIAKGEKLSFEYHLVVPEEVGYNAKGYTNYTVYYKIDTQDYSNQCSAGIFTEEKEIDMDDIKEEDKKEVATLTVGTQVSQGGKVLGEEDSVYERQVLKYTLVVRNTSDITANNVVIKANAENANLYYFKTEYYESYEGYGEDIGEYIEDTDNEKQYEEFTIESLEPGESRTYEYQVIVKRLNEMENSEVYGKIVISADNIDNQNISTIKNNVNEAKLEIRIATKGTETVNNMDQKSNTNIYYRAFVKNLSGEKLKNVILTINIPDNMSFLEDYYINGAEGLPLDFQKNAAGSSLMITFPEMSENYENDIFFPVYIHSFDTSSLFEVINISANIQWNDEIYNSNNYTNTICQSEIDYEYSWISNAERDILEDGDTVNYLFKIKNNGVIKVENITINNMVPTGLEIEEVTIIDANGEKKLSETDSMILGELSVGVEDEAVINITTRVNSQLFLRDQSTIDNKLKINGRNYFDDFETNVISYKINNTFVTEEEETSKAPVEEPTYQQPQQQTQNEPTQPSEPSNTPQIPENPNPEPENTNNNENSNNNDNNQSTEKVKTYYISGLAWIDSNQDGIRQSDELPKEAVIASLYKANSNGGLDTSGLVDTTATGSDGRYSFSGVQTGNYIIVFDYGTDKYKITKYQVDNATSVENSDAISKKVTLNGKSELYAVTDVLEVKVASLISIDIGLVDKTNFDMSLEKGISSIKVTNDSGTKTYDYQNNKNARLEIRSKYYKSTTLDITYNFKITNEGEVAGYVNKVVDYLPSDVEVVLNSSPDWYIGSDNGLYYTGLVNQEIKAGETKEFTLVIRKSLANGEAVRLTNSAELVEVTNNQGLYDKDSIENNKMTIEDDYGTASLTISISTGNTVGYIGTALIIIIMVASMGMMVIKFKNTKKIYR